MARSTFYYHLKALERADRYEVEKKRICEIFHESKGRYGYRRVTMHLKGQTDMRWRRSVYVKYSMRVKAAMAIAASPCNSITKALPSITRRWRG